MSADGATLAVGAPGEASAALAQGGGPNDDSARNAGAVYVFVRSGTQWSQQSYLKASNAQQDDIFGTAMALSADGATLAVSAPLEDSGARRVGGNQGDNGASNAGAVYVFVRVGAQWSQEAYVKASNSEQDDQFGGSTFGGAVAVSADGNVLAVGAPGEDSSATGIGGNQADEGARGAGAAYIFVRAGDQWTQQAYVKASGTEVGDTFGFSVALSADGRTLAVAAPGEDSNATGIDGNQLDNDVESAGALYLF
jgi:hypothetical protein